MGAICMLPWIWSLMTSQEELVCFAVIHHTRHGGISKSYLIHVDGKNFAPRIFKNVLCGLSHYLLH